MWERTKLWINQMLGRVGYHISRVQPPAPAEPAPTPEPPRPGEPPGGIPRLLRQQPEALLHVTLDYIIQHHLANMDARDFFFVQVGAYDGATNDPLNHYVRRYGWRGILLEPQAEPFRALQATYADQPQLTLLQAAIGPQDGPQDFFTVRKEDGLPAWSQQIASFKRDNILKHEHGVPDYGITGGIADIGRLVDTQKVECLRFDTLFDRYNISRLDLLQIDAEGFDAELIGLLNFERTKPHILRYEHMHLSSDAQEETLMRLMAQGYKFTFEFSDTIAYLA